VRSLTGHADLVRVVAALRGRGEAIAGELAVAVESLGFVRVEAPRKKESVESPGDEPPGGGEVATGEGGASAPPRAQPEVPFWQPYRFEWRTDEELDAADLRRREEVEGDLAADAREGEARAALASPEAEPLTPRSRLVPLLQRAVTAELRGREIDVPGLVRRWSRGELVRALPRVRRRGWPALVLLLDRGHHLRPFWGDQVAVRDLLRGMLGRAGLVVRFVDDRGPDGVVFDSRGRPSSIADGSLAGMPIVAVSDLGWYGGPAARRGWLRLGRELRAAGERIFALVPVPPSRWTPELAELWSAIAWERPRSEEDEGVEEGARVEAVVDLAALVRRLEPGLLRGLRGLVPGADVGTEADAWMHGDVEASAAGWAQVRREAVAERRGRLAGREEVARAAAVIRRWHWNPARKPELWHVEALEMAEVAPGAVGREVVAAAERFMVRLGRRTVMMAEEPGREAQVDAIRRWLDHVAAQAPGFLDPSGEVGRALQQAWGATHPPDVLPPDPDLGMLALGRGGTTGRWKEPRYILWQTEEWLSCAHAEMASRPRRTPLGGLVGAIWGLDPVAVRVGARREALPALYAGVQCDWKVGGGEAIEVRSARSTLALRPLVKPRWARALGRDHQGLWAEVEVGAVRFRMRWIPPGFFWMGSPVGEPGRYEDEVRHPVVLTRGYWLGETPVTQALWEAVMRGNPSRFVDPRRPVEQVSWEDVQEFVAAMNGAIEADEDGAIFRLPSEAEWEYACRAGTESATYAGAMEIKGERNAPVLDRIAWYGGNSGVGYDLAEGHDSSGWGEKQHEHSKAGTRPVKGKVANSWGLYDMLGNVWEWCEDAWLTDRSELVQEWQSAGRGAGRLPGRDAEMASRVPGLPADLARRAGSVLVDPYFPGSAGDHRVPRGGSWYSRARVVRAASRHRWHPGVRRAVLGFRLARGQGLQGPEGRSPGGRRGR